MPPGLRAGIFSGGLRIGRVLSGGRDGGDGEEHVFLAHHQAGSVERGEFEAMSVGDGIGGASFDAIPAEDATVVIDVVDLRIALRRGDALLGGVFGGFDEDAICGTGRRAQKAGYALFQAVFVALQNVRAAEAFFKFRSAHGSLAVGVIFDLGGLKDLPKGDAHAFGYGRDIAHNRHNPSIRWIPWRR